MYLHTALSEEQCFDLSLAVVRSLKNQSLNGLHSDLPPVRLFSLIWSASLSNQHSPWQSRGSCYHSLAFVGGVVDVDSVVGGLGAVDSVGDGLGAVDLVGAGLEAGVVVGGLVSVNPGGGVGGVFPIAKPNISEVHHELLFILEDGDGEPARLHFAALVHSAFDPHVPDHIGVWIPCDGLSEVSAKEGNLISRESCQHLPED